MTNRFLNPLALIAGVFSLYICSAQAQVESQDKPPGTTADAVSEAASNPYAWDSHTAFESAEQKLNGYLESKHWRQGWDEKHKRMFVVQSEQFNADDPAYDDQFITKRSVYVTLANMAGKAEIAEFMRTQMSAVDQLYAPGTDVYEQLNADFVRQQRKFEAQKRLVMKLAAQQDAAEAEKLAGVTWDDRGKALMDAVIKKLDKSFDAGKIAADKAKAYERAKTKYAEAAAELTRLEQAAQAIKGQVKLETVSSVETLAKAPILGATVLAQAESYDPEKQVYEVAVLMVWSHKLEDSARALMTTEPMTLKAKPGVTLENWATGQDLSTLVGSRQLIDEKGDRWFIGAYSAPYGDSASARRKAKGIANLMAKKEAVMAVYADLETHKQAQIATQTRNAGLGNKDYVAVSDSFAETTRQAVENRQVNGLSKIISKVVTHPISGQPIYVVAYAISGSSAAQALQMEAKSYKDQLAVIAGQQRQRGIHAGYQQAVEAAKASNVEFSKGVATAKAQLQQKAEQGNSEAQNTNEPKHDDAQNTSRPTSVINVSEVDDDDF